MKWKAAGASVLLATGLLLSLAEPARAQWSDYEWNRRQGQTSSDLTLKYGGTYGQAGQNYMNYRYGYGTGNNRDYYSPYYQPDRGQQLTPQKQQEINQLLQKTDNLIKYYQSPEFWQQFHY